MQVPSNTGSGSLFLGRNLLLLLRFWRIVLHHDLMLNYFAFDFESRRDLSFLHINLNGVVLIRVYRLNTPVQSLNVEVRSVNESLRHRWLNFQILLFNNLFRCFHYL